MATDGVSQNQLALDRLRAEARLRSEEVSRQSSKAAELQQEKNSISAGFGGENKISYYTGDGDIVGTTGQVTPVLDRPGVQPVGATSVSEFESIAASSHKDVAAGSLLLAGDHLSQQGSIPPEMQKQLGAYAIQLAVAEDVPPEVLERVENNVRELEKMATGASDLADMDSLMMALESDFSHNSLKFRAEQQLQVHKKIEALRKLAPILNHMVDDAKNGYMGKEWSGDKINKMLESYGIDLQLSPEELDVFNNLLQKIDGDGIDRGSKAEKQQQEFMEGVVELFLEAMGLDADIDAKDFAGKIINTFSADHDRSAHYMPNGGYKVSDEEKAGYEELLVEISGGADIAAQHHKDAHEETMRIPKHI